MSAKSPPDATSETPEASPSADLHWETLLRLVSSGRIQIAPAGEAVVAGKGKAARRWAKRLVAVAVLGGLGLATGWLVGNQIVGIAAAVVFILLFVWLLKVGAPEPFDQPYLGNPALFERSYLSGAIVLDDTKLKVRHEYPTEWRRIATEIG